MIDLPGCEPIKAYADMTDEEWKGLRRTGIGGSDAAAVMGMSKYSSPLSVCMEKTGRIDNEVAGEMIDVGNILEPIIRQEVVPEFLKRNFPDLNFKVYNPTHMYRSIDYPWMVANTDGFVSELIGYDITEWLVRGLEIKTGSSYVMKEWGGREGEEIPDAYYCQNQHYMAVTGIDEWWTFGLIGNERVFRIVPRNQAFIDEMIERERDLWERIQLNDPLHFPAPSGTDADMEALLALGDPQQDSTVDLSELEADIDLYNQLKIEIDDRTEERERAKQRIIMAMQNSRYGETDDRKVTFARWTSERFDQKRFSKDYPELYRSYRKKDESETSRLFVSLKK